MARKTNTAINGSQYYRVTAVIGRDSKGKLVRKQFYGKNKKEAEDKKNEYLNGIKSGLKLDSQNVTLGELMHLWLFQVIKLKIKASSFEKYEGLYRNYIKDSSIGILKINDIKSIQIQKYYNKLHADGKSSNLIKNTNKLLKQFLNYAVDEGYIIKNPCWGKRIVIPEETISPKEEIKIFTDDEISQLEKNLRTSRLKCLILTALTTGLRQGELLALTWNDVDLDNMEIIVNKTIKRVKIINSDGTKKNKILIQPPKTKNSNRIVPIPSELVPILKEHHLKQKLEKIKAGEVYEDNNIVFATTLGKYIDAKNLFRSYKNLLRNAGIEHKKFHCLRHTYATKLFESNIPLKTISMLLGHSSIEITANIYTHVIPKQKIDAAEKLNSILKPKIKNN